MSVVAKLTEPKMATETFAAAFAKLQADIPPAIKDATNPAFRSKYADLAAIWEAIRKPLAQHGFSVLQTPDFAGDSIWLKTVILHSSGECIEGRYPLRPIKQDPQGFGSALTYARRYSISAMLGVVADEDDDGNAASARPSAQSSAIHTPHTMQQDDEDKKAIVNWVTEQKAFLTNCKTVADVQDWLELRESALDRLKHKSLPDWSSLMRFKEIRIGNINLENVEPIK